MFAAHNHALESVVSLICVLLWVKCEFSSLFRKDLQTFQIFWFPVKSGHCGCEGFGQFRDSFDVVAEIGWITVRRQLLKGQQNLVCFNCHMGVFAVKMWLTCRPRLLFFPWRSSRGAVGNLFSNSCHYMLSLFLLWIV